MKMYGHKEGCMCGICMLGYEEIQKLSTSFMSSIDRLPEPPPGYKKYVLTCPCAECVAKRARRNEAQEETENPFGGTSPGMKALPRVQAENKTFRLLDTLIPPLSTGNPNIDGCPDVDRWLTECRRKILNYLTERHHEDDASS